MCDTVIVKYRDPSHPSVTYSGVVKLAFDFQTKVFKLLCRGGRRYFIMKCDEVAVGKDVEIVDTL